MELLLIKQPYPLSFSGNPVHFSFAVTPYRTSEMALDIKIIVRVEVEDDPDALVFITAKEAALYPAKDGTATINIQTILKSFLSQYIPPPSQSIPSEARGQVKRYKISYHLLNNNVVVSNSVQVTDIYHIIKGGISYQQWHPKKYYTQLLTEKNFLRYPVDQEKVFRDEKKYLSWIYPYDDGLLQYIHYTIGLSDGTVTAEAAMSVGISGNQWQENITPAGFNQLGLNAVVPPGSTAVWYSLRVINENDVVICNPQKFYLDYRQFYDTKDLLFVNSLSAIETIRLRGQIDANAEYERIKAQKVTAPDYFDNNGLLDAPEENTYTAELEIFKGDTGFLAKDALDRLRDLFISKKNIYEIKDGRLIPVTLINKNANWYNNRQKLYSNTLEWQHAFTNDHYTPAGTIITAQACPALENFIVRQSSANKLSIAWALETGYNKIQVSINIDGVITTQVLYGNHGQQEISFQNPAPPETAHLTVLYTVTNNDDGTQTIVFNYEYSGPGNVSIDYRILGAGVFTNIPATSPQSITVPVGVHEVKFRHYDTLYDLEISPVFVVEETITEPLEFSNSETHDIIVTGQTICNDLVDPADLGPVTTISIAVHGKLKPTAVDDHFQAYSNDQIIFPTSVMENDYDIDGSPFIVIPNSGVTPRGGIFAIDINGIVTFTPNFSQFVNSDFFTYVISQTDLLSLQDSATVYIKRSFTSGGSSNNIVYVKTVLRNVTHNFESGLRNNYGEVWLEFYSDAAGSSPMDVTGMGR